MKNLFRISGVILIIILVFSEGCKKSDQGQLLEIISSLGFDIVTPNSAILSGNITSNSDSTISEWGVCWSTDHLPVITDYKVSSVPYNGYVSFTITGLNKQSGYYVRAYATNSTGTAYGEELSFTTPADLTGETGNVTDADGNVYQTIGIGSQIWMVENLKTTKYCNGDIIGTTTPATLDISAEAAPKYQWAFDGDESNVATYGRLYTWYAVTDSRNVCPTDWHVPTDAEWTKLTTYLGGEAVAGDKLKETGITHWTTPNTGSTNETGFTALPGGYRYLDGSIINIGLVGFWWSSDESSATDAYYHYMICYFSYLSKLYDNKKFGLSVRCIKD